MLSRLGQAGEEGVDHLLAVGQVVGQCRRLRHDVRDGPRLALEDVDDRSGQLVHLVGREGGEQRLEAVEHRRQVDGRRGVGEGDDSSGRQGPAAGGSGEDGQEALAQQVLEVDGGQRGRGQVLRVVDAEGDVGVVLLQGHRADLPDLDAGDPDRVAGLQLRGVGELGHVPGCGLRVHVEQCRDHDRGEDDRHDGEDDDLDHGAGEPWPAVVRSHDRVTRPSRTGESNSVETAGEEGGEPLTAATICETARRLGRFGHHRGRGRRRRATSRPDGDRAASVVMVPGRGVGRRVHETRAQPGREVGGGLGSTENGQPEVGRIGDDLGLGQLR